MISKSDETLLRRALRIAMNGRGRAEPNPMVGCVLAKSGRVIAEGWHNQFGGPHAEPAALADCRSLGHDPRGATAYVTLEPCCHTNKQTPPCVPRLIEAGIARVVIGCLDPNPDVDGNGVAMLRAAGVDVAAAPPPLAGKFLQLIAPFTKRTAGGGPYLTLKWAESRDGKIAGPFGERTAISSPPMNKVVHRTRGRCDAIVVGANTVVIDNPNLLPRGVETSRTPTRVVLDSALRTRPHCRLVRTAADGPVLIFMSKDWHRDFHAQAEKLRGLGVEVFADVPTEDDEFSDTLSLPHVMAEWVRRGWTHVLAEPGPTLAESLLPVADRLWVIRASMKIGDDAPTAANVPAAYVRTGRFKLGPDTLTEYLNRDAASFVTATPSADFVLEAGAAKSA